MKQVKINDSWHLLEEDRTQHRGDHSWVFTVCNKLRRIKKDDLQIENETEKIDCLICMSIVKSRKNS